MVRQGLALLAAMAIAWLPMAGQRVVIVSTNDTHSQMTPDRRTGLGGVARRLALLDSIREANEHVITVDAGDAVQGSLFYTLFDGEVEKGVMNKLGYDIQILGNHEFDNGIEQLKENIEGAEAEFVTTNYDLSATELAGKFTPYVIREAEGKRIGFIGLNVKPQGLIEPQNVEGVRYVDPSEAANSMARHLKGVMGVDKVVVLSHLGFDTAPGADDVSVARHSTDIDLIIGGHSHQMVNPESDSSRVANAQGVPVQILQGVNKGMYVGVTTIDFDKNTIEPQLIAVDSRFDREDTAREIDELLALYVHQVDSISAIAISRSDKDLPRESVQLLNVVTDYVLGRGERLTGRPVDIAIMNKGGIRNDINHGEITKGEIMDMLPFENSIVVIELKGADLLENLEVMARQGGNGLSRGMDVRYDPKDNRIVSARLNGKAIEPERTYRIATITYLAGGGDDMAPLSRGEEIARSPRIIFEDIIADMESGVVSSWPGDSDDKQRMKSTK